MNPALRAVMRFERGFGRVLPTGFLLINFSPSVNGGVCVFSVSVVAAAYMRRSKADRAVVQFVNVHEMKEMSMYVCGSLF